MQNCVNEANILHFQIRVGEKAKQGKVLFVYHTFNIKAIEGVVRDLVLNK